MPLLEGDHAVLVEVALPVCERYGRAITGGYAMKAPGLVDRPSDDIDFPTRGLAPVEEITEALAAAYRLAGCQARVVKTGGRFGHLGVALPSGAACRADILKEPLRSHGTTKPTGPTMTSGDRG
jgi:hypothetical protein